MVDAHRPVGPALLPSRGPARFAVHLSWPPSFQYFLQDCLLVLGLPYGPQAREALARSYPGLFGHGYELTLRGYRRWLVRQGLTDSGEAFTRYMDGRYQRWVTTSHLWPAR